MKSRFYMTIHKDQFNGCTNKKLQSIPQSHTCTTKRFMVTVWWSAACLIYYSFLNPRKNITSENYAQKINKKYWNLQHLHPALVNRKGPILLCDKAWLHITLQNLNEMGCQVLSYLPYSLDLSLTEYYLFKHLENFAAEMLLQATGHRKCF